MLIWGYEFPMNLSVVEQQKTKQKQTNKQTNKNKAKENSYKEIITQRVRNQNNLGEYKSL